MNIKEKLYKSMLLIRRFEEKVAEIYHSDVIKSPVHLSIGQEAVAVGVCEALESGDYVSNTYRCHATHIAKGGDLNQMMAELYGKKSGCAGGKAGSMHLIDMSKGVLGASAIVGSTIPVAAGYAFVLKRERQAGKHKKILVCFFGDGATEEGCFSEAINFAALQKLPIIFVCENNGLAIHNHVSNRWASLDICKRIETYGVKTCKISSGDVLEIYEKTKKIVDELRESGEGPYFMEISTYRYKEHVGPMEDLNEEYRDMSEYKYWKERDQIDQLAKDLSQDVQSKIAAEVENQITAAIEFSENSEFPEEQELYNNIYA